MLDRLTIERMAEKAGKSPILIALSGGGDSVALMHLLADALTGCDLRAVVIDHRLRDGSWKDAKKAAAFAEARGLAAQIEALTWEDGASSAHEAARQGRYVALCKAAHLCGAHLIVTGHTRDDQAETVLLRAERGSGLRGLSAMRALAPAPVWPEGQGLWIARPLLNARRAALRGYLGARGGEWIEDPANENAGFSRVRVRRALAELERGGLDPMRLAALAERLGGHAERIDYAAAELIDAAATFLDDRIVVAHAAWRGGAETKQRALQVLIAAAGAHARGPASRQVLDLVAALQQSSFGGVTLAGARIKPRGGSIVIDRDRGALAGRADGATPVPPLPLAAGVTTVWDRRVALMIAEPGWSVVFECDAPTLARGEERLALAAASPQWLVKSRVQHLLGMDNNGKSS